MSLIIHFSPLHHWLYNHDFPIFSHQHWYIYIDRSYYYNLLVPHDFCWQTPFFRRTRAVLGSITWLRCCKGLWGWLQTRPAPALDIWWLYDYMVVSKNRGSPSYPFFVGIFHKPSSLLVSKRQWKPSKSQWLIIVLGTFGHLYAPFSDGNICVCLNLLIKGYHRIPKVHIFQATKFFH